MARKPKDSDGFEAVLDLANARLPGQTPSWESAFEPRFGTLSLEDIAAFWRRCVTTPSTRWTDEMRAFDDYVGRIGDDDGNAVLVFLCALMVHEQDEDILALAARSRMLNQFVVWQTERAAEVFTELAGHPWPRLGWFLGPVVWQCRYIREHREAAARITALADEPAWKAYLDRPRQPTPPIDFAGLTPHALADVWLRYNGASHLDNWRDDNAAALFDYEYGKLRQDPDRSFDFMVAVAGREDGEPFMTTLAVGLLEDLIAPANMGLIERAAAREPRFGLMLNLARYHDMPKAIQDRLDALARQSCALK